MGYGGIIKTVVRVVATSVGAYACGAPCAAIGSALATGATGGSFKESLMAGVTAYATTTIGADITGGIESAAAEQAASTAIQSGLIDPIGGAQTFAVLGSDLTGAGFADAGQFFSTVAADTTGVAAQAAAQGFVDAGLGSTPLLGSTALDLVNTPVSEIPIIGDIAGAPGLGKVGDVVRTPFDFFKDNQFLNLKDLGFSPAQLAPIGMDTAADLIGQGAGGLLGLSLGDALANPDVAGVDAILGTKFSPEQILALRSEARNALSQTAFEQLTGEGGTALGLNPFGGEGGPEEFENVLAQGLRRLDVSLGPATQTDIESAFANPNLAQNILGEERDIRRRSFESEIGAEFPGSAFGEDLDQDIVDSIITERKGPALEQISRFGARGNLNPTGGKTANIFIEEQIPEARRRVEEVGAGVLGGGQRDVDVIRERAREQAGGYELGEGLFDVAPFSEERRGLIEERQGTLGTDVRGAIGTEPLFDVSGALQAGGRAQGVVSGRGQNPALLDQIAARELGSLSSRNRRSLGSRGSGAF
jgi:hypothetical protein